MCRVLGVSTSGYWAWRRRPIALRRAADLQLKERIRSIHQMSRQIYGAPRVHAQLRHDGIACGRKRVARLMREEGLVGCHRRGWIRTTMRNGSGPAAAPDLVGRAFTAPRPNRLWVADITYVPTWVGFLYVAVVIDVFSRRVVGWSMSNTLKAELVVRALDMAITRRRPQGEVIHHSDQGSQYTSVAFGRRCREEGVQPSTGSVGDCYDNAMAESFFASLECELLERSTFRNRTEARRAVFDYIEIYYNQQRLHSSLGYRSPCEFEQRFAETTREAA